MNQTSNGSSSRNVPEVHVRLDEGVLDGLVGVGRVAQVVERDAHRPALVPQHQLGKALASRFETARGLQGLHVNRHAGVGFSGAHGWRGGLLSSRLRCGVASVYGVGRLHHIVSLHRCLRKPFRGSGRSVRRFARFEPPHPERRTPRLPRPEPAHQSGLLSLPPASSPENSRAESSGAPRHAWPSPLRPSGRVPRRARTPCRRSSTIRPR